MGSREIAKEVDSSCWDESDNPWGAMPCKPFSWFDGASSSDAAPALDRKAMLHLDFAAGELQINGAPLIIANQDHKGNDDTGLAVWDGAVVLAKYIEHLEGQGQCIVRGRRVLELGCGTGLCGIACAMMGAQSVVLSDLEYALRGARRNIELNGNRLHDSAAHVWARELNWCKGLPP